MPRLGEPVEPSHGLAPTPWWRAVDRPDSVEASAPARAADATLAKGMPWPVD
jgi:hypothetical protein